MERLITFITGNIGLVIIVIVFLAGLLNKAGRGMGGQTERKPVHPMPSFGGGPNESRQDRSGMLREAERRMGEERRNKIEREQSGEGVTMEGKPSTSPAVRAGTPSGLSLASGYAAHDPASASEIGTTRDQTRTLEKEDLISAVVWSEVLGPPRAKKPWRR